MRGELSGLWAGWRFSRDELLYAPGWRRGIEPGEILALPYVRAEACYHERRVGELLELVRTLETETAEAHEAARRYRRLLTLESRLGLMLERVQS